VSVDVKRLAADLRRTATVLRIKREALAAASEALSNTQHVSTMVVQCSDRRVIVKFVVKRR
jgi:hypothetical protein